MRVPSGSEAVMSCPSGASSRPPVFPERHTAAPAVTTSSAAAAQEKILNQFFGASGIADVTRRVREQRRVHASIQRLERLHTPLKERVTAYEKRIEELEKDLAAKGEQNRELIQARISVARQQLTVERERGRFGAN